MRLLLVGPPGAGKGTQARRLADDLSVPHIATGELLREAVAAGTDVGVQAKGFMDRGDLVPDDLMIELFDERIARPDAGDGFILDGFPRTQAQAYTLDLALQHRDGLDRVVLLEVPAEEIVRRLSGRRACPECHRAYHVEDDPPAPSRVCDDCGSNLTQRTDDEPDTVRHRLEVYEESTAGLANHYKAKGLLRRVDGTGDVDKVSELIGEALG